MPADAPPTKVAATRGYGAEVVTYDRYTEDRAALATKLAEERGLTLIPPYDHYDVMAGQGTVALELIEEVGPLGALLVPVGGGGLIAGCATAATALSPGIRMIGVEPAAGDDHARSLAAGQRVEIDGAADDRRRSGGLDAGRTDVRGQPAAGRGVRAGHRRRDPGRDGVRVRAAEDRPGAERRERAGGVAGRPGRRTSRSASEWCFQAGTWAWRGCWSCSAKGEPGYALCPLSHSSNLASVTQVTETGCAAA